MKRVLIVGIFIIILVVAIFLTIKRPAEDAATSIGVETTPTSTQTQTLEDDWNKDGTIDEQDAALYHR